jgi:hypothetical protein
VGYTDGAQANAINLSEKQKNNENMAETITPGRRQVLSLHMQEFPRLSFQRN